MTLQIYFAVKHPFRQQSNFILLPQFVRLFVRFFIIGKINTLNCLQNGRSKMANCSLTINDVTMTLLLLIQITIYEQTS